MSGRSSQRTVDQIAATVGEPVVAAWSWSSFREFVVARPGEPGLHAHGWFDMIRKEFGWDTPVQTPHREECAVLFPSYVDERAAVLR